MTARLFLAILCIFALPILGKAQSKGNVMAEPKFGLSWEVPKNWKKSSIANGIKYHSKSEEDYIRVVGVTIPATPEEREKVINKFLKEETSLRYKDFVEDAKEITLNNLKGLSIIEDDEPDLEEAEDKDDYEGLWTRIFITEHKGKLIMVSLTEIYNKRRKLEKDYEVIFKSIKAK